MHQNWTRKPLKTSSWEKETGNVYPQPRHWWHLRGFLRVSHEQHDIHQKTTANKRA